MGADARRAGCAELPLLLSVYCQPGTTSSTAMMTRLSHRLQQTKVNHFTEFYTTEYSKELDINFSV